MAERDEKKSMGQPPRSGGGWGGGVQALAATFTPDAFQPGGGNLLSLSPDCDYEA